MRPFKSGKGLAIWLLRIALLLSVFSLYSNIISTLAFTSSAFMFAAILVILSVLLVIGGLINKPWLTVISGLIISLFTIYKMFVSFNGSVSHYVVFQFFTLAIAVFFFTNGNDN